MVGRLKKAVVTMDPPKISNLGYVILLNSTLIKSYMQINLEILTQIFFPQQEPILETH